MLTSDDRATIFAYWMAGERRRASILERRRENARRTSYNRGESSLAQSQVPTVTELDAVLGRMHEALDGGTRRRSRR